MARSGSMAAARRRTFTIGDHYTQPVGAAAVSAEHPTVTRRGPYQQAGEKRACVVEGTSTATWRLGVPGARRSSPGQTAFSRVLQGPKAVGRADGETREGVMDRVRTGWAREHDHGGGGGSNVPAIHMHPIAIFDGQNQIKQTDPPEVQPANLLGCSTAVSRLYIRSSDIVRQDKSMARRCENKTKLVMFFHVSTFYPVNAVALYGRTMLGGAKLHWGTE